MNKQEANRHRIQPVRSRLHTSDKENKPKENRPQESKSEETGGPKGPEPTRYGDWERNGRCVDF